MSDFVAGGLIAAPLALIIGAIAGYKVAFWVLGKWLGQIAASGKVEQVDLDRLGLS